MKNNIKKYIIIILALVIIISPGLLFIDFSGDGTILFEDIQYGTNPLSQDTTGDGLTDYEEIHKYGTDPTTTDTTGDGLSDYEEIHKYGTDPTTVDTTGDQLADYDEIYELGTDPTTTDTTGDGLKDVDEVTKYGTDPTTTDTTGDGLSDYEEIHKYGTDPNTKDTSDDGLSDYDEINKYGTDPTKIDTTGDGLSDYDEINEYGTDPTTTDTTGDGLSDYDELTEYGTDPTTKYTTEDGFSDYEEIKILDTNPYTHTVLLEIDYTEEVGTVPDEEIDKIKNVFNSASVSDYEDTYGIELHVYISEEPVEDVDEVTPMKYIDSYYNETFENNGYGFHHALITGENAYSEDGIDVEGFALRDEPGMVVQDTDELMGPVLLHELGHSLGIMPEDHEGVDSTDYEITEYPSIMNYNFLAQSNNPYQFSDGSSGSGDFNDWKHIIENFEEFKPRSDLLTEDTDLDL